MQIFEKLFHILREFDEYCITNYKISDRLINLLCKLLIEHVKVKIEHFAKEISILMWGEIESKSIVAFISEKKLLRSAWQHT